MADSIEEFELSPEYSDKYCSGKAWALPRLTPQDVIANKYEVIIVGGGPAGLLLKLLLTRFGLGDESVLCLDAGSGPKRVGRADGMSPRTCEMLATLGLEHGVVRQGCMIAEEVEYRRHAGEYTKITHRPYQFGSARFGQFYTLHQGRFESLLLEDLRHYSNVGVQYSSPVSNVMFDESDTEYPIKVEACTAGVTCQFRAKYVVGADGAHSIVRRDFGIKMEGDSTDEVWGVMDFVPETNFPDVRRFARFSNDEGVMKGFIIPREKLSDGNHQIRFYVDMQVGASENNKSRDNELRENVRHRKVEIKSAYILQRIKDLVAPFEISLRPGTKPIWRTVFGVGQRLANKFAVFDQYGHPRVFLAGDACHTHSPRQGQGLNISVQDAYYLSWRMAYAIFGLTHNPIALLSTYEEERRSWAERVVFADKRWNQSGYTWDDVREEMRGQVTGCGVQEDAGLLTSVENRAVNWQGRDLLDGVLRTGRRLLNVRVTRWGDGIPWDIHDDFVSDGRYRILVLAAKDFPRGRSALAMDELSRLLTRYTVGVVELVLVQPHHGDLTFGWHDVPVEIKRQAEMKLHSADEKVYETYGVSLEMGVVALVRPDGVVAITVNLEEVDLIQDMLDRVLVFNG